MIPRRIGDMGKFFAGTIVVSLLAGSIVAYSGDNAPPRHHNDPPRMIQAINAIPLHPGWRQIKINEITNNNCDVTILYRTNPGAFQAEEDTKTVARLVLAEMVREGGSPAKDLSNLSVTALQDGLFGETGQPLVRPFGMTNYSYNYDRLEYTPYEKWLWHPGT
jgi:hypothetical protein